MIITPNLHFNGVCKKALALYETAFDGKITQLFQYSDADPSDYNIDQLTESEKEQVYHAEMMIGNQRFFFSDSFDSVPYGQTISIVITFDSGDEVKKAYDVLSKEGEVLQQLIETTYSGCFTSIIDRFGIRWELMTENSRS
ncbi:VOC family protein [Vallitalea okinawensis]|uniref:VOC family protein n=1 Tax=Vallitalea okinawensis TaxID=2078660 RepID=UPI000CFDC1A7|nr:VOC family protein [Vallitalea okinawensis]